MTDLHVAMVELQLAGEKQSAQRKSAPITLQNTLNSIWTTMGLNPGLHEEMPVTNILIYIYTIKPT